MMLSLFRQRYPQGSLVSELVKIDRGIYIVKVSVQINNLILASALAGADRVEAAEDAARERAIAALALDSNSTAKDAINTSPPAAFVPQEPVNNSNIVNFSEDRSEIPTQPSVSASDVASDVTPVPSIWDPVTQPNREPDPETVRPVANSSNLFDDTFTDEILENSDSAEPEYLTGRTSPALEGQGQPLTNNNFSPDSTAEADFPTAATEVDAMDFNEIKQKTDIEIRRLGWTKDDGRDFLKSRYGKRTRLHLTDEQLLEFLRYLEKLPTPVK